MTSSRARHRIAASALAAALALAGCSGLPTTGPVSVGNAPGDAVDDTTTVRYAADEPRPGWSPAEIVDGFLKASISPEQNWATAREFLEGDLAETWDPAAGITIDATDDRDIPGLEQDPAEEGEEEPEETPDDDAEGGTETAALTAQVHTRATVDADGRYRSADEGSSTALSFELARDEAGEWRITSAPDGIVLDSAYFLELYSPHDLYYFDATWTALVPDSRWFPNLQNAATRIVQELVEGAPSEWLAPAVETAFGADMQLSRGTVPVDADRVAAVEITGAAGADDETLSRMRAQLEQSLAATEVRSVQLTIDGQAADVDAAPIVSTRINSTPLVMTDDGFGHLAGGELSPIAGLSGILVDFPEEIRSISLSPQEDVAVLGLEDGSVWRVTEESPDEVQVGARSVAPALDRFGFAWTVRPGDPASLTAWDADLTPIPLSGGWADVSAVKAVDISRDGSRIAALVTIGGQEWAVVSAIERDFDGTPLSVGAPVRLAQLRLSGIDLAWIDDGTIGIAAGGSASAQLISQPIGAPQTTATAPLGVVAIAAGNQDTTVRMLTNGGDLVVLRGGTNPTTSASGVKVLATQIGLPD